MLLFIHNESVHVDFTLLQLSKFAFLMFVGVKNIKMHGCIVDIGISSHWGIGLGIASSNWQLQLTKIVIPSFKIHIEMKML